MRQWLRDRWRYLTTYVTFRCLAWYWSRIPFAMLARWPRRDVQLLYDFTVTALTTPVAQMFPTIHDNNALRRMHAVIHAVPVCQSGYWLRAELDRRMRRRGIVEVDPNPTPHYEAVEKERT